MSNRWRRLQRSAGFSRRDAAFRRELRPGDGRWNVGLVKRRRYPRRARRPKTESPAQRMSSAHRLHVEPHRFSRICTGRPTRPNGQLQADSEDRTPENPSPQQAHQPSVLRDTQARKDRLSHLSPAPLAGCGGVLCGGQRQTRMNLPSLPRCQLVRIAYRNFTLRLSRSRPHRRRAIRWDPTTSGGRPRFPDPREGWRRGERAELELQILQCGASPLDLALEPSPLGLPTGHAPSPEF